MLSRQEYLAIATALTLLGCSGRNNDNPVAPIQPQPGNTPPEVFIWSPGGELVSVPVPSDANWIIPSTFSDRGDIVGTVGYFGSRYSAFVWSSVVGFRVLSSGLDSEANGISASGAILGYFSAGIGAYGPFLWKLGSSPEQIATQPLLSYGIDINTAGHVAGGRGYDAVLWTAENGLVFITNPSDTIHSRAIALNDRDDILVNTGRATKRTSSLDVPGIWSGGVLTAIGCQTCVAHDVNNSREVVGSLDGHAFLWRAESGVMRLVAPEGTISEAVAINDKGDIVGWVRDRGLTQAAIWTESGSKLVLPFPGLASTASAINNRGQVIVVRSF